MMRSIQRTFPLFVTALLLAVAILQLTIGYGEVRQASRVHCASRICTVTWAGRITSRAPIRPHGLPQSVNEHR